MRNCGSLYQGKIKARRIRGAPSVRLGLSEGSSARQEDVEAITSRALIVAGKDTIAERVALSPGLPPSLPGRVLRGEWPGPSGASLNKMQPARRRQLAPVETADLRLRRRRRHQDGACNGAGNAECESSHDSLLWSLGCVLCAGTPQQLSKMLHRVAPGARGLRCQAAIAIVRRAVLAGRLGRQLAGASTAGHRSDHRHPAPPAWADQKSTPGRVDALMTEPVV
jgi:hypothetical protein